MESLDPVVRKLSKAKISVEHRISAAANKGVEQLLLSLLPLALEEREKRQKVDELASPKTDLPVIQPHTGSIRMGAYRIEQDAEGAIIVRGKRIEQFTVMTNFQSEGGLERFRDVLDRIGLRRELKRLRAEKDVPVFIGTVAVDEYL
jgi:Obg family GTPase CgtA-like protein